MSQRAYMLAARDLLQNLFNVDANSCDVGLDGQPKPACGETAVMIHEGTWQGTSDDDDLEELFSVCVTVTRRTGYAPKDRYGTAILDFQDTGLEAVLRQIIPAIHKNYYLMNAANACYIPAPFTGFYEPLLFADGGQCMEKGPDWFTAQEIQGPKYQNSGVAQTLTFSQARRTQQIFPQVYLTPPGLPILGEPIGAIYMLPHVTPYVPWPVNTPYSQQFTATGGRYDVAETYTFTLVSGALPDHVTLTTGGLLAGTPTIVGTYSFRLKATATAGDGSVFTWQQNYRIVVA